MYNRISNNNYINQYKGRWMSSENLEYKTEESSLTI